MNNTEVIISIIIMSIVTAAIRFLPFIVFNGNKVPAWVTYMGKYLPYSIMGMLVIFCLKNVDFHQFSGFVPEFVASLVVVVLYLIKKNTLLSILAGTLFYMYLVQTVFV